MMMNRRTRAWLLLSVLLVYNSVAALLMSDLPTPSLVLDMQALQRFVDSAANNEPLIPPLSLSNDRGVLYPCEISDDASSLLDSKEPPVRIRDAQRNEPFCYLHSSVVRSREQAVQGQDDPVSTFLAQLDLAPSVHCGNSGAELVLGLNNHHVGSYYWARSAGSGAAMEAPGVLFDTSTGERGILRWQKEGGPIECNSNDGKRSEWVNFLRAADTVQLLPFDIEVVVLAMSASDGEPGRIFGVSSRNRPLGSEPEVICKWRLQ